MQRGGGVASANNALSPPDAPRVQLPRAVKELAIEEKM